MANKKIKRTYEYKVFSILPLPPPEVKENPNDPVMTARDMEWSLNDLDQHGWIFVSYGEKAWLNGMIQRWWIFRREVK
jgi:hypothetical protein